MRTGSEPSRPAGNYLGGIWYGLASLGHPTPFLGLHVKSRLAKDMRLVGDIRLIATWFNCK
jgi:hypothetical protein